MSALSEYLAELKRQAELLADATERDSVGEFFAMRPERPREPGQRRIWTRQDRNRVEQQVVEDEFAALWNDALARGDPPPLELLPISRARISTRVEKILSRLPSVERWHRAALSE